MADETKTTPKVQAQPKAAAPTKTATSGKVAVVLIRGQVGLPQPVKDTLTMLHLGRKNHCVVIPNTAQMMGMVKKVKDYVTYGEITEDTFKQLVEKRGEAFQGRTSDAKNKYTYKTLEVNGKHYKPYFRLNPPQKGFGRKGIKTAFKTGGTLGYRGDKMNDLVLAML